MGNSKHLFKLNRNFPPKAGIRKPRDGALMLDVIRTAAQMREMNLLDNFIRHLRSCSLLLPPNPQHFLCVSNWCLPDHANTDVLEWIIKSTVQWPKSGYKNDHFPLFSVQVFWLFLCHTFLFFSNSCISDLLLFYTHNDGKENTIFNVLEILLQYINSLTLLKMSLILFCTVLGSSGFWKGC